MYEWLTSKATTTQLITTGILLLIVLFVRRLIVRNIRKNEGLSNDLRRRWLAQIRLATFLFILLGVLFVWGAQLQSFALSVVAIAAAIVIATKELIMCVSGSILRASGKEFVIGDRIEVSGVRGDVVDQTLLATTLLEIGPGQSVHQHTGRTIVLPNSIFLTAPVINETFTDDYVLHAFSVPLGEGDDWTAAEEALAAATREECRSYLQDAKEHMESLVRARGLEAMSVEPRVTLHMPEPKRLNLLVRVPAPARKKGRIEQAILRRFFTMWKPLEKKEEAAEPVAN